MALLDDEDSAELAEALKIYKSWKETRQDLRRREGEQEQDLAARWKRLEQGMDIERLKGLQGLSAEVLIIAAKDPEQQKIFYSLARLHIFKDMTPEKIILVLLNERPELEKVAREIIMAMHDAGRLEQYERLIKEINENAGLQREQYQGNLQALTQLFNQALAAVLDVAKGRG